MRGRDNEAELIFEPLLATFPQIKSYHPKDPGSTINSSERNHNRIAKNKRQKKNLNSQNFFKMH
jgi:hypothetical protein